MGLPGIQLYHLYHLCATYVQFGFEPHNVALMPLLL